MLETDDGLGLLLVTSSNSLYLQNGFYVYVKFILFESRLQQVKSIEPYNNLDKRIQYCLFL